MTTKTEEQTSVGSYFVSNYPPFSAWKKENLAGARAALESPPEPEVPLGLYLHIPFCRKRCKFCYFRVYTDKNAHDVETYVDALTQEVALYRDLPILQSRPLQFVYFGGGTPSYLSSRQLRSLVERLQKSIRWDQAREVTFECEPGTLSQDKLRTLKEIGVTRLSLGIENFNDAILEENGRAHLSAEIDRAYGWAREAGFDSINIDLIAGMVGETWENWRSCIAKAIAMEPDCLTIYQMELPYNTIFSRDVLATNQSPVADWDTKRAWVDYAFREMEDAGYSVSSAYTVVRGREQNRFEYRDSLWHGADMIGTGVASFSHVGGTHYQNVDTWEDYVGMISRGELPLGRALTLTPHQLLVRELILQLKLGEIDAGYFREKFQVEISQVFGDALAQLTEQGWLKVEGDRVVLSRGGLLRVDGLLPEFYEQQFRSARYT